MREVMTINNFILEAVKVLLTKINLIKCKLMYMKESICPLTPSSLPIIYVSGIALGGDPPKGGVTLAVR